jgi:hypothetical protein
MYEYITPPGFGDTFYQYVFDAVLDGPLTDGIDALGLGIKIVDGDFLLRYWSGLTTIADSLQIYDWLKRGIAASPMFLGAGPHTSNGFPFANAVVAPEILYPVNGNIRFDLINVTQQASATTGLLSQMVFTGVRRRPGVTSDPVPSAYKYYEKQFAVGNADGTPYSISITNYAAANSPLRFQIPIVDYDFELRRIELALQSDQQTSQFKMTLYNSDKVAMSNRPVLSNCLLHLDPLHSSGEMNFWPCPPIMYRVNSVISFDIWSLLSAPTTLPQTFKLLFHGVRRIPC